ncbi:MAG: PDR/VanB family oxidoreductase [Marinomonadaceae bacterium]
MSNSQLMVKVDSIKQVAPTIKEFVLTAINNEVLLPFSPGSHVVVTMQDGEVKRRNPYSLLGDPLDTQQYKIAVRLQDQSRGGSVFMHDSVHEGDELSISAPSNLFAPYWRAKKHVLFAGGVGITPFMSFLPDLLRRGEEVELHYMFHSTKTGAYLEELTALLGEKLICYDSDQAERCNVSQVMSTQPLGTHLYVCGPEALLAGIQESANKQGWPASAIHFEAFTAPAAGKAFVVELKRSKRNIEVKADTTMLEALEAANVDIQSSCRSGVCGRCFTTVLDGTIEHRDDFLSTLEKSQQNCVMPCVSRSANGTLVLDL